MTPEERAASRVEWMNRARTRHDMLEALTLICREAENDALERAAQWHEQLAVAFDGAGARREAGQHREHAAAIRALKSEDAA